MTKKERVIRRKNIRNYLPKYDLGTSLDNTQTEPYQMTQQIGQGVAEKGRQTGNQYITTARQDKQGANLSGKAEAYNRAATSSALETITAPIMTSLAGGMAAQAVSNYVSSYGATSASGVLGSGIGAIGAGVLGLGKGIYDAFTVADQFDTPAISDSEFDAMKGEQTLSGIHGVQYKQKTGVNMSDVAQIGAAKEGADIAAAANAGMGIGAGVGGTAAGILSLAGALTSVPFLGWILGPILGAVGAGLGAGIGAGATDASDEAIAQAQQVNNSIERWNTHEMAVANSQGIRELFDERQKKLHGGGDATDGNSAQAVATADKGKSSYGKASYTFLPSMFGDVATSNGVKKGNINAIVGRGEVVANTENGTAFNVTYGKRGNEENVKANLKDSDMVLSDSPDMIIPGTDYFIPGGITPAAAGRESAEQIYQINKAVDRDSKYRDLHTQKFQQEQADKAKQPHLQNLQLINSVQDYMKKSKEYKNGIEHAQHGRSPYGNLPHYNFGSALLQYGLPNLGGLFSTIGNAIMYADAKNEDIAPAPQIHRSNADAQRAIQAMRSSYNANPELAAARTINRLQNYANRHNGYTAGQRMAMDQSAYANYGSLVQKILADKQNKSVALWNAKQQALANLRDADVTRQMESNKYAHEWKARAEAAKQKRVDTYGSALYNNIQNWFQNIGNSITTGKMLKLYSDELDWKKNQNKKPITSSTTNQTLNTNVLPQIRQLFGDYNLELPVWMKPQTTQQQYETTQQQYVIRPMLVDNPWNKSDELDWKRGGNDNNKYPTDVPRLTFNTPDWKLTGKIQPLLTPIKPLDVQFDQNAYFNSPLFQNDLRSLMQQIYN